MIQLKQQIRLRGGEVIASSNRQKLVSQLRLLLTQDDILESDQPPIDRFLHPDRTRSDKIPLINITDENPIKPLLPILIVPDSSSNKLNHSKRKSPPKNSHLEITTETTRTKKQKKNDELINMPNDFPQKEISQDKELNRDIEKLISNRTLKRPSNELLKSLEEFNESMDKLAQFNDILQNLDTDKDSFKEKLTMIHEELQEMITI